MKIKEAKRNTLRFIGNFILSTSVNLLCKSLRITYSNKEALEELERENKNYVVAFWHGTMLLSWYAHRDKKIVGLTSQSKDGDLLAKVLRKWSYEVVRGSSSTGGSVALGIMVDYAKNNYSVAVTPDGPTGPIHKFKAGAVVAAKKSRRPLILCGAGFQKKRFLNSWDKFQIPEFFSKAKIVYSDPIFIDENLSYEETSNVIEECESQLIYLQNKASDF